MSTKIKFLNAKGSKVEIFKKNLCSEKSVKLIFLVIYTEVKPPIRGKKSLLKILLVLSFIQIFFKLKQLN